MTLYLKQKIARLESQIETHVKINHKLCKQIKEHEENIKTLCDRFPQLPIALYVKK